jgi:hypothetical protein
MIRFDAFSAIFELQELPSRPQKRQGGCRAMSEGTLFVLDGERLLVRK